MFNKIKKIIRLLNNREKNKFKLLIFLMFFAVIFETLSIGIIIPLINYFVYDSTFLLQSLNLENFLLTTNLSDENILVFILLSIVVIFLIKNIYMAFYYWFENKFAYKVRYDIGVRLFQKYLNSPYTFHIENNSSNLISKIEQETANYGAGLMFVNILFVEILMLFGIAIFLFLIRPFETLFIVLVSLPLSLIFYLMVKNVVSRLGKKREVAQKGKIKSMQQGLGAIKDIIIYKAQKNFIEIFHSDSNKMADVGMKTMFLLKLPKIWFELTSVIIITLLIFLLSSDDSGTKAVMSTMGIFLVAFIKMIPSINKILISLQNIRYSEAACDSLYVDLKKLDTTQSLKTEIKQIDFQNEIRFENVFFSHSNKNNPTLENINILIKKNEFIGIQGETGSGKSTFVDLLVGLITPTSGKIFSDTVDIQKNIFSWRKNFGYVPQNLYLLDDTISNNIAIGQKNEEISKLKVDNSIKQSQLSKFISSLENGLQTMVGERGVKISGGEKQRIGIARALYNNPNILIFDEGTSALDSETEAKILKVLLQLKGKKTIIFISHKKSNLDFCDKRFKIENKQITQIV